MLSGSIHLRCDAISDAFKGLKPAHPQFVEFAKVETDQHYVLIAVERDATKAPLAERYWGQRLDAGQYAGLRRDVMDWPMQAVVVEQTKAPGKITIERNRQAECGLTLLAKGGTVHLHWDPTELYAYLDLEDAIDVGTCAANLELLLRYSEHTIFKGVYHLPERAKAVFNGTDLDILRPTPIAPIEAVPLASGADPVEMFHTLVRKGIARWPLDPHRTGAILSSGLDTTIVAHFLTEELRPMAAQPLKTFGYSMMDTPENRDAIAAMRAANVARLGADDTYPLIEANMDEAYSLSADRRWPGLTQTDFAETHLSKIMQKAGITLAFTGIGGDELCSISPAERLALGATPARALPGVDGEKTDWFSLLQPQAETAIPDTVKLAWPNGYVGFSAPDMAAAIGTFYLRRGIWCANPLSSAELHAFTHFLPVEWRNKRRLSREAMARLGYSPTFTAQVPKEGLRATMAALLARVDFEGIFRDSILCDLGIIDRTTLMAAVSSIRSNYTVNVGIKLLVALDIERGLQSLHQQRPMAKSA